MSKFNPKSLTPNYIASFVKKNYDLENIIQQPEIMIGGVENAGWRIKTNNGNYVLKINVKEANNLDWVNKEVELYSILK